MNSLTHIESEHGREAYSLIDFGNSIARMSMVFLDQLKIWYPRYNYKIEVHGDFEKTHPTSVYKEASETMDGLITTNWTALQLAKMQLELTKLSGQFKTLEGAAFLLFNLN